MGGALSLLLLGGAACQGAVLFEDAARRRVCGPAYERSFHVSLSTPARVEIKALRGLTKEHKGGAKLWLDDSLLGPLRPQHQAGGWINPRPLTLGAGAHTLSIECGAESFEIEGLRVTSGSPAPRPPAPAPTALPSPAPSRLPDCAPLSSHPSWPGKPGRSILLSVVQGRAASSGLLATLKRGQTTTWWFRISRLPETTGLEYPPIVLNHRLGPDGLHQLEFALDHEELKAIKKKRMPAYQPLGYVPNRWTPMRLDFCPDGRLGISLNFGKVSSTLKIQEQEMPLEVHSREIELEIKGEKP